MDGGLGFICEAAAHRLPPYGNVDLPGSAHEILVPNQIFHGPKEDTSGSNSDLAYRGWTEDVKFAV